MPLTDTAIRKTKPEQKPLKLRDGGDLYLILRPDGARWWRLDYRRPATQNRGGVDLGPDLFIGYATGSRAHRHHAIRRRAGRTHAPPAP